MSCTARTEVWLSVVFRLLYVFKWNCELVQILNSEQCSHLSVSVAPLGIIHQGNFTPLVWVLYYQCGCVGRMGVGWARVYCNNEDLFNWSGIELADDKKAPAPIVYRVVLNGLTHGDTLCTFTASSRPTVAVASHGGARHHRGPPRRTSSQHFGLRAYLGLTAASAFRVLVRPTLAVDTWQRVFQSPGKRLVNTIDYNGSWASL